MKIFKKFWSKLRFLTVLLKIKMFGQFQKTCIFFFENIDQNRDFAKFLPNSGFSKILNNIEIFEDIDQNQYFRIFIAQSAFSRYFENFWNFLLQARFSGNFYQNFDFLK